MKTVGALVRRNVKLFFKDKGTFFTAMITPIILLVLYATFLYNVYENSFRAAIPPEFMVDDSLIKGLVGGLLLSSLLAVSCVTVPFCANLFMVQDRVSGAKADLSIAPIKPRTLAFSYYFATVINGLIIGFIALAMGLIYLAIIGWYLSFADILLMILDIVLLVLFGAALSSLVCYPLQSQGAISAVGSIVSSCYGFLCGAYMPISSFGAGLRNALAFLPGTHATSLIRNHTLSGVFEEMAATGLPSEVLTALRDVSDSNLYLFEGLIDPWIMYTVLIAGIVLLLSAYILINFLSSRTKISKKQK